LAEGYEAVQGRWPERDVERQQQRGIRSHIGDPGGLAQKVGQVEFGDDDDRLLGNMAGDNHRGVAVGLLHGLIRRRREAAQIQHVRPQIGDDAVQATLFEGCQQALEITELARQGCPLEGRRLQLSHDLWPGKAFNNRAPRRGRNSADAGSA
jgi:hypothetical protein